MREQSPVEKVIQRTVLEWFESGAQRTGWSFYEWAKRAGIDRNVKNKIAAGQRPSYVDLSRLAGAAGIDLPTPQFPSDVLQQLQKT